MSVIDKDNQEYIKSAQKKQQLENQQRKVSSERLVSNHLNFDSCVNFDPQSCVYEFDKFMPISRLNKSRFNSEDATDTNSKNNYFKTPNDKMDDLASPYSNPLKNFDQSVKPEFVQSFVMIDGNDVKKDSLSTKDDDFLESFVIVNKDDGAIGLQGLMNRPQPLLINNQFQWDSMQSPLKNMSPAKNLPQKKTSLGGNDTIKTPDEIKGESIT